MLNFPDAPVNGAVFTSAGKSWVWDTVKWGATGVAAVIGDPTTIPHGGTSATSAPQALINLGAVAKAGDTMTGALGVGSVGINYPAYEGHYFAFGWTGQTILHVDGTSQGAIAMASQLSNYLPISGGNLTGALSIQGGLSVNGAIASTANISGRDIIATSASLRTITGNYGTFWYNDGGSLFYLLLTNNGDPNGSWNTLRPLQITLGTGAVYMGHGLTVSGAIQSPTTGNNFGDLTVGNVQINGSILGCTGTISCSGWGYFAAIQLSGVQISNNGGYCYTPQPIYSAASPNAFYGPNGNVNVGGNCICAALQAGSGSSTIGGALEVKGGGNSIYASAGNIVTAGVFWTFNYGQQPGGGVWVDSNSDRRTKKNIKDYKTGLGTLIKLNPVTYQHNGKGESLDDGRVFTGLIANDVQGVMPEIVRTRMGKLNPDDEKETEILGLNATALTYALINAVKELAQRLAALEGTQP